MKRYTKSPLPSSLKSIPKGFVYLGKGGEFKTLPDLAEFQGYCMFSTNTFNNSRVDGTVVSGWNGNVGYYFYFAPADSEIARLNGLAPRKRKVANPVAAKLEAKYIVGPFRDSTAYFKIEGSDSFLVETDGTAHPASKYHWSAEGIMGMVGEGFWRVVDEKTALSRLSPKPAPKPTATIGEVWDAFKAYASSTGHSLDALLLCKDGSGKILNLHDKVLASFDSLPEALRKIKAATV